MLKIENNLSDIYLGNKLDINKYFDTSQYSDVFMICDENINELYPDYLQEYKRIVVDSGESNKTLITVESIITSLSDYNADRHCLIIAVGGGVLLDTIGFVASIYMRGISFAYVPTTLLAMVDASIGGKTAVNFAGSKNMIGTFSQAVFIASDIKFLSTLPSDEIISAYGEIVKHSLISTSKHFDSIQSNIDTLKKQDFSALGLIIYKSIKFKVEIVEQDRKEQKIRKILNFGHTLGHPIEIIYGIKHGQAVGLGIKLALHISKQLSNLSSAEEKVILSLLEELSILPDIKIDMQKIINLLAKDKKKNKDSIDFILLEKIGKPLIKRIPISTITRLLNDYSQ